MLWSVAVDSNQVASSMGTHTTVAVHYHLGETIWVPRPIQRPRPKILIGGVGERKTLSPLQVDPVAAGPSFGPKIRLRITDDRGPGIREWAGSRKPGACRRIISKHRP